MRFSELEGRRLGVWGAGREISSFARAVARRLPGAEIAVAAFDDPPDAGRVGSSLGGASPLVVGPQQAQQALGACEVVIRSPGASVHKPQLAALRAAGIPVTTATALWLAEHGPDGVLGVSGTKGKSTTAALTAHLAAAAGVAVALAGNIGVPAIELLDAEPAELTVLELSSFQIADLDTGPEVVVMTNLFKEHTEWHGSEEGYRREKLRLLSLPEVRVAVLNAREPLLSGAATDAEVLLYGDPDGWDAGPDGVSRAGERVLTPDQLPLPGEHNALNLCAALSGLQALAVEPPLPSALEGFEPLAHRLQVVADGAGITWVNDSISTTPESTLAALASFPGRELVLIAGGQDRGQDYAALGAALARAGTSVIGVPSTGGHVVSAATAAGLPSERALEAGDLGEAVEIARTLAVTGTVVLLSPAAPSFDHYRDFEQRGERFAELVRAGAHKKTPPPR
ncbi:MAG TPA: UDP-N-acetylmuramoyl-L-alanine--D-glutamate ligase [Solirubrobacteraceae bacterium]|nr:UDP-N-acetylmuramoyl-L-alanine--D-glutamate ligase [Solirubrobacteraceae bacterium]